MFKYEDIHTKTILNKRWYVCPKSLYPSITTMLGDTQSEEKSQILENWKNRIGEQEAQAITEESGRHGSIVHELIEHWLNNDIQKIQKVQALDKDIKTFNAMKMHLSKITKIYGLEVALYSDELGIAGRTDCVGEYLDVPSIIDFKTSRRIKTAKDIHDYWLQCAFYAKAHNELYGTNIEQGVIIMGVTGGMPLIWKQNLHPFYDELKDRINTFYNQLNNLINI